MIQFCLKSNIIEANKIILDFWNAGYSAIDILGNISKVTKSTPNLAEHSRLEFLKVFIVKRVIF